MLKKLPDYEKIKKELSEGLTWENFIELSKRIRKNLKSNNSFYLFQADKYEGLMCSFAELLGNLENPLISKEGKLNLQTPEAEKAFQFLIDLVNKYRISPKDVCYLRENESYKYFSDNDAFAVRGWPSFMSKDNKYVKQELFKNIEKAPTPYLSGSKPASVFGGWNLMISKYSDKIPEVVKFIEFLLSPESQKILYEEGGYLPVNRDLYDDKEFVLKHPDLIFYQNLFKQGVHRPMDENYTTFSDLISLYLSKAIEQNLSPKEVINEIIKQTNEKILTLK
jgi:multiple sugar transport system substrate-binding protein